MNNSRETLSKIIDIKDISEKDYRDLPLVSYSFLSELNEDPLKAKLILDGYKRDPTDAQKDGTLLDDLCYLSKDAFQNKYHIANIKQPSDKLKNIADLLLLEYKDVKSLKDIPDKKILEIARHFKYNSNQLDDTLIRNVKKNILGYFNGMISAKGKVLISNEKYYYFSNIRDTLESHPFTSKYFNSRLSAETELHFQVPLVVENINRITVKGLLDAIFIDHEEKTIRPIDLKKDGLGKTKFTSTYYSYNYYLQGALYYHLLSKCVKDEYKEYTVLNPLYIVANVKDPERPLLFEPTKEDLEAGLYGGYFKSNPDKRVKGIYELIDEFFWHEENNLWDYSKEHYENNGIVPLNKLKLVSNNDTHNKQ